MKNPAASETGFNAGISILSRPFRAVETVEPAFLYPADGDGGGVILERGGVHFINSSAFIPDSETEAALDGDFRDLVDSVIRAD